jgi:IS605 OrfB family transposase
VFALAPSQSLGGQAWEIPLHPDVMFAYGQQQVLAAMNNPKGQAISYRFKKDAKSWRVFTSTALPKADCISQEELGVIGIDQAKATKKPLVIENLDFRKKKLTLQDSGNKKFSRLLSGFAYGLFFACLIARAFKEGIEIYRVNPAFTSTIGRINYAKRYGLSIHLAAALCIARRYQKFSEAPCSSHGQIPDGKGGYVAFVLPVRNRIKHVWHFWGSVKKKLTTVLVAYFQAIHRSSSPPIPTLATANSS